MNTITVSGATGSTIDRNIYGHFAEHLGRCIYGGFWVGEEAKTANVRGIRADLVRAIRAIAPPVLRWPGGCFADEYHWRDGIGARPGRRAMVNTHWGQVVEDNQFGTHEFFDLCGQLGAEPYVCLNVGSGTVREAQEWIEYITFDGGSPLADERRRNGREDPWSLRYVGVGNENWGCGGNMRPEYYADLYRQYATYVRSLSGNRVFRIACGANGEDYHWTEVLMRQAGRRFDGLSLHKYTSPGQGSRSATDFGEAEWFAMLRGAFAIDDLIARHAAIMDRHDPQRRVALCMDEWGAWYDVEPGTPPGFLFQQNSLRDAVLAAIHFNVFHAHCHRVRMANIAQTVNVLQAVALTQGAEMVLTPTYHVFEMSRVHQDAAMLPVEVACEPYAFHGERIPAVSASASRDAFGRIHLTVCNCTPSAEIDVACELPGGPWTTVSGRTLTGPSIQAHNAFGTAPAVAPTPYEARVRAGGLDLRLPARSVTVLEVAQGA